MIRAIIFDCFGVLTTDGWLPFKQRYFGHDQALLDRASEINKLSDAGLMPYQDFITEVSEMAGVEPHDTRQAIEGNVANEPLFEIIAGFQGAYKLGFLSNASGNWLDRLFTPEQQGVFDAFALSYETGVVKPNPRAYEIISDRLNVPIEECVLVDDQERFCTGAREAGMQAIWYKGFEQFKSELTALLQ